MKVGKSMMKLINDFYNLPYGLYAVEIKRKDALKASLIVLNKENGIKTSGEKINLKEHFDYTIETLF